MSVLSLRRFGDVVLDLERVVLVAGSHVWMDDGREYDVGDKAADAIRSCFTPEPAAGRREPSQDTCDTAPEDLPGSHATMSCEQEEESSSVRARLQCPSSSITSFPEAEDSGRAEEVTSDK